MPPLIGGAHGQPGLLVRHRRLTACWEAARAEPVHARVLAEPFAAAPRP